MKSAFFVLSALCVFTSSPALAAPYGILSGLEKARASLVSVEALSQPWMNSASQALVGIDAQSGRAVVRQKLTQARFQKLGAGVIIHPRGIIVTNAHNIAKAQFISVVLADQSRWQADVLTFVQGWDIALLKIDAPRPLPAVPLADSDKVNLGEKVFTIGHSPLLKQTVSSGRIIGLGTRRHPNGRSSQTRTTDLIQTTLGLYEGDSGGPLFNQEGQLIGMMTAKETQGRQSSFAVPSQKILNFLVETLEQNPDLIADKP